MGGRLAGFLNGYQRMALMAELSGTTPSTSSAPGSRSQARHPLTGDERTRQQPGRLRSAAVAYAVMPSK
jgi:hypothetical protein